MMLQDNEATVHFTVEAGLAGASNFNLNSFSKVATSQQSDGGFRCITCNRGPPHTKKYARN